MIEVLKERIEVLEDEKKTLDIRIMARTRKLEEFNKLLEDKVKERTKELQQKMEELKKFHDLTVGRELKMLELKKELAKYKKIKEKLLKPEL